MKIRDVQTLVLRHELPPAEVFGSAKGPRGRPDRAAGGAGPGLGLTLDREALKRYGV